MNIAYLLHSCNIKLHDALMQTFAPSGAAYE